MNFKMKNVIVRTGLLTRALVLVVLLGSCMASCSHYTAKEELERQRLVEQRVRQEMELERQKRELEDLKRQQRYDKLHQSL
jgi:cytochrome c556